jgi:prepilin peptidase CpaA
MIAYLQYPIINKIICIIVAFIGMVTDTYKGKIYNWLTFPSIVLGWGLCFWLNGLPGLGYSFLATILGIAIYLPLAIIGAYGMGDVKLMGAIGSICGSIFVFNVFLYTSIIGFFHALIVHFMNHGTSSLMLIYTSIKSGSFKYNTIQKENTNEETKNNIKYNLGLDIFIAVLIACYYCFTW